jgi:CRP-like cAMP-binding protein
MTYRKERRQSRTEEHKVRYKQFSTSIVSSYKRLLCMFLPFFRIFSEPMETFLPDIPRLKKEWERYAHLFKERHVPARTMLLREGAVSRSMFFIKQGCIRAGFTESARELTLQFFFEHERVASFESFMTSSPSDLFLETVEPTSVFVLQKNDFDLLMREFPELKDIFLQVIVRRFSRYANLFRSHISKNPKQRYLELLKTEPRILQRVPQHYIASYLGITPVSLSRIRNKIR